MVRKTFQAIRDEMFGLGSAGTFANNFAVTLSGNVTAQALGFLLTPFIARVYGPQAYGVFALFMSIANTLAPFSTLQFPSGYPVVKEDTEFRHLIRLTVTWLVFFVIATALIGWWAGEALSARFHIPELSMLLLVLPVQFLFSGLDEILLGWSIRAASFRRSAVSRVVSVLFGKGLTLLLGLWSGPRALGIVAGNLVQYPVDSLLRLSSGMRASLGSVLSPLPMQEAKELFRKYSAYPKYVTTGLVLSNLGNQLPVYLFSASYATSLVGLYAMANSLVMMPLNLVVNSTTAVFLQKSSTVSHNNPADLARITEKLHVRLFWFSLVALTSFGLVSDWLITFLLGEPWRTSGQVAGLLAIGAIFCASSFSLSVIYRQVHRESLNFIQQGVFLAAKLGVLLWAVASESMLFAAAALSVITMISYLVNLAVVFRLVGLPPRSLAWQGLVSGLAMAVIFIVKFKG